jgi:hypothetical protein
MVELHAEEAEALALALKAGTRSRPFLFLT